ncbi:hypothetical protein GCM10009594_11470 [Kocuria palustris]|uniref:arylamine N-acetyltransferase family protein n=1 Tax=Kocuria palustris TaxID=71999 RepID=UPI00195AC446|nr:arylamine N-acetyltransferase [Kocuria palustris]MBM7823714.1 arylamine N-acetyltransferase [Kocuria palustris]
MPADLTGSSWRTEDFDIPAYLQRIGIEPGPASLELLEAVHQAHVRTLPFTNVDILLGTYPGAAPAAVQRQLIERRRGGYCFAHGQLMAAALEHLGFEVTRHLGRVGSPDRARTHTSLEVRLDDGAWFADPGFGFSIRGPMPLRDGAVRDEGGRLFELSLVGGGGGVHGLGAAPRRRVPARLRQTARAPGRHAHRGPDHLRRPRPWPVHRDADGQPLDG